VVQVVGLRYEIKYDLDKIANNLKKNQKFGLLRFLKGFKNLKKPSFIRGSFPAQILLKMPSDDMIMSTGGRDRSRK